MDIPKEVLEALVKAQAQVRAVGKDGNNQHHRYRYTSAEALIDAATAWMAAAGMALVQCGWRSVPPELTGMPDRLEVTYVVTAGGALWVMPVVSTPILPEKGRPWDKAEATALTYNLGYTLRGLLKIPRVDTDDDVDQRDDRDHVPAERTEQPLITLEERIAKVLDGLAEAKTRADIQLWADRWRTIVDKAPDDAVQAVKAAAEGAKARVAERGLQATEPMVDRTADEKAAYQAAMEDSGDRT